MVIDDQSAERRESAIRQRAVTLLAAREHGARELEQKLRRKFPGAEDEIDQVLDWLAEVGLQSDERYLEQLVRSRIARGYGPHYIIQELRSKGLATSGLDRLDSWADADWSAELARQVDGRPLNDRKDWERLVRRLVRRGYPSDLVRDAVGDMPI